MDEDRCDSSSTAVGLKRRPNRVSRPEATVAVIAAETNSGPLLAGARDKEVYRLRPDGGQRLVQDAALLVITITSRSPCRIRRGGAPAWTR